MKDLVLGNIPYIGTQIEALDHSCRELFVSGAILRFVDNVAVFQVVIDKSEKVLCFLKVLP